MIITLAVQIVILESPPKRNEIYSASNEGNDVHTSIERAFGRTQLTRHAVVVLLGVMMMPAFAQTVREVQTTVKPGSTVVVDTVGCASNIKGAAAASVLTVSAGTKTLLIYSSTADQREDRSFTADVGAKASADGKTCEDTVNRQYTLSFNAAPEVSGKALQTSFQVLVAAFVLALLLESAFALLFNWRPFNAFLNGRSVRSPIMFLASLVVVHEFHFDLMAQLFDAYFPSGAGASSSPGTGVLTAMILAGGSAGVNRILTTLGFRSQVKDGEVQPTPDDTHAWIAVAVEPATMKDKLVVAVSEVVPAPNATVSTAVGIASARRPGWRSLFLGEDFRVPRSGGMRVDTSKFYSITVTNLDTGMLYDVTGKPVGPTGSPTIFRFGPRAVLDFRIKMS